MKIQAFLILFLSFNLFAQVMDTDTPDTQYLTDEEVKYSQEFVHEGLSQKILQEECEGIEEYCKGMEMDETFLGIPTEMMDLVGQAYNIMTGMGASELKLSDKSLASARAKDPIARDYKPDYCAKIPMATDMLAKFKQTSEQDNLKNLPVEGDSVQKQELLKAAKSHKTESETSTIQATGYGIAATCYVAMVAAGGVAISSVAVKLPAVGILTAYHTTNAIRQNEIYERVKKIADKLPGQGECNPITEKECYCDTYEILKKDQEKLTKENEARLEEAKKGNTDKYVEKTVILDEAGADKYCKPQLHASSLSEDSMRVSCVDSQMQLDPYCKCKGENSCYDQEFVKFATDITPEMYASSGISDFSSMTKGELRGGRVGSEGFARNAAKTNSLMKQYALKNPASGDLHPKALSTAKMAEDTFGIPKELAANLTARPPSAADREAYKKVAGGDSDGKLRMRGDTPDKNQVLTFTQPDAPVRRKTGPTKQAEDIKLQRGKASESGNVLMFAEKAAAKAQVEQRPEANIFHLISKRYQISGARYLQLDGGDQNAK